VADGVTAPLRPGLPVGIGGLPHDDPEAAARLVLDAQPELPACPQLPAIGEGMLDQVRPWLADDTTPSVLPTGAWGAAHAFFDLVAAEPPPALKLQVAGPVTVGWALADTGVPDQEGLARATRAVEAALTAVVGAARRAAPRAGIVVFLDEPRLSLSSDGRVGPWSRPEAACALGAAVGHLGALGCTSGVHCCARPDWSVLAQAAPTIVSLPAALLGGGDAAQAARHLGRGGWIAWGVLPTDRPLSSDVDAHQLVQALRARWDQLAAAGGDDRFDPALASARGLVSADCGLSGFSEADACRALHVVAAAGDILGARVGTGR